VLTIERYQIPVVISDLSPEEFGTRCALFLCMIALFVLASAGAGALLFMLAFLKALVRESRLRSSSRLDQCEIDQGRITERRIDQRRSQAREASLTLVMLERYRNDRAA
jgi:hypothetical protein